MINNVIYLKKIIQWTLLFFILLGLIVFIYISSMPFLYDLKSLVNNSNISLIKYINEINCKASICSENGASSSKKIED